MKHKTRRLAAFAGAAALVVALPAAAFAVVQTFDDVPPEHVHYDAVEWMASNNLTNGCSEVPSLYCPDDDVSRAEMAQFLNNYHDEFSGDYQPAGDYSDPFQIYVNSNDDDLAGDCGYLCTDETTITASCEEGDSAIAVAAEVPAEDGFLKFEGTGFSGGDGWGTWVTGSNSWDSGGYGYVQTTCIHWGSEVP
jgi:hypothetical protein